MAVGRNQDALGGWLCAARLAGCGQSAADRPVPPGPCPPRPCGWPGRRPESARCKVSLPAPGGGWSLSWLPPSNAAILLDFLFQNGASVLRKSIRNSAAAKASCDGCWR
jgi:hypothetical protein